MPSCRKSWLICNLQIALVFVLATAPTLHAADSISLTGRLQQVACAAACGICCGSHILSDSTGSISMLVGNSFADLTGLSDNSSLHRFSGSFYQAPAQCNIGQCQLFVIETVDAVVIPEAVYSPETEQVHIPSVRIGDSKERYAVTLRPPFAIDSLVQLTAATILRQGASCVANETGCAAGLKCVEYYGVAGGSGPLFKTCEIPCGNVGSICPVGQSCVVVADGPGRVCQ